MDHKEKQNLRLYLLGVFLSLILLSYLGLLCNAQIVHHDDYTAKSINSIVRPEKVEASRGILTDRNGRVLVSNRSTYALTFDASLLGAEDDENQALLRLVTLCRDQGVSWTDNLPISRQAPYVFTVESLSSTQRGHFLKYLLSLSTVKDALGAYLLRHPEVLPPLEAEETEEDPDAPAPTPAQLAASLAERLTGDALTSELLNNAGISPVHLMNAMRESFHIPEDFTQEQARLVLGAQYELSLRKLVSSYDAYILAEDVDTSFISLLSDGRYAGAKVTSSSVREYQTACAAHILGYVGRFESREDYNAVKDQGYDFDDYIGVAGAEKAFEPYLKGTDGYRMVSSNTDGKITGEYYSVEPEPGAIVELTIDLDFQQQVEDILADTVNRMNAEDGDEARGAGAAVIKVGTGEVLALASCPTYNLSTFRQDMAELSADPATPMYNRAAKGTYPPGSTLKPFTAIAALEHGDVTLKEKIRDTGRWNYPGDEQNSYFHCWHRAGHGYQTVTQAITNSCNYFFGELGYRMGMETIREYLQMFGLGVPTGIEIDESTGTLPENPPGQNQAPWAGFGQSTQLYSPLQLANYVATLVSGGKHCQAHLLKTVKAYDNSRVIAVGNTEPVNTISIEDEHLQAVKQGMRGLVTGTLAPYFSRCVVDAGAKTGTAQVYSNVKNHGVFVCFAPYDEPEIAVAIAIERGSSGANLATTAVNILNAYFTPTGEAGLITGENQLLP